MCSTPLLFLCLSLSLSLTSSLPCLVPTVFLLRVWIPLSLWLSVVACAVLFLRHKNLERQKCVVFLVGLNGYNQRLFEDSSVNKMQESLTLFQQVRKRSKKMKKG